MGVHISIVDMRTGKEVPEWNWLRHAGDCEVLDVSTALPHQTTADGDPMDGVFYTRPDDVEQFRAALHAAFDYNTERWNKMCDLLAVDPNRALYFSW